MWPLFMHQYCNFLSFLISRQKLGPHGRSEWLWAASTGAHSQPSTCVQRRQVPQAAWARATPARAHSRAALPAQARRHRPRYRLQGLPGTSFLVQHGLQGAGAGVHRRVRSSSFPAAGRWGSSGTTPHPVVYSFHSCLRDKGEWVHFSGTPHSSWSPGFPRLDISHPSKLFPKRHTLQTCSTLIFIIHVFHGMNSFFPNWENFIVTNIYKGNLRVFFSTSPIPPED